MSFTHKNLHTHKSGITFLKGATFFFLGMSCVLFLTQGFEIVPSVKNTKQIIKEIVFTKDGYIDSPNTITIDGSGGNAKFAGSVKSSEFCLGNNLYDDCITSRSDAGVGVGGTTAPGGSNGDVQLKSGTGFVGGPNLTWGNSTLTINGTGQASVLSAPKICLGTASNACQTSWPSGGGGGDSIWLTGENGSAYYNQGKVGIGTNDPHAKLDVAGDLKVKAGNAQTYIKMAASNGPTVWQFTNEHDTTGFVLGLRYSGTLLPTMLFGSEYNNVAIGGWLNNDTALNVSGAGKFSDRLIVDGRVGIGTNTPYAELQVGKGIGNVSIGQSFLGDTGRYITNYLGFNTTYSGNTRVNQTDGYSNGGTAILSSLGGNMYFATFPIIGTGIQTHTSITGNIKMTINNNGNVGIGAWGEDGTALYVSGAGRFTNGLKVRGTVDDIAVLDVRAKGKDKVAVFTNDGDGGELNISMGDSEVLIRNMKNDKSMEMHTHTSAGVPNQNQLHLLSNGNVGIGTNNPQAKLQIGKKSVSSEDVDMLVSNGIGIYNHKNTMQSVINQDDKTLSIQQNIYYSGGYKLFSGSLGGTLISMSNKKIGFYDFQPGNSGLSEMATLIPEYQSSSTASSRLTVGGLHLKNSRNKLYGDTTEIPDANNSCRSTDAGLLVYTQEQTTSTLLICAKTGEGQYKWKQVW